MFEYKCSEKGIKLIFENSFNSEVILFTDYMKLKQSLKNLENIQISDLEINEMINVLIVDDIESNRY